MAITNVLGFALLGSVGPYQSARWVVGVWNALFFLLERVFLSSGIVLGIQVEMNRQNHS